MPADADALALGAWRSLGVAAGAHTIKLSGCPYWGETVLMVGWRPCASGAICNQIITISSQQGWVLLPLRAGLRLACFDVSCPIPS